MRVHFAGLDPPLDAGTSVVQDHGIVAQPIGNRAVQRKAPLLGEAVSVHEPILSLPR